MSQVRYDFYPWPNNQLAGRVFFFRIGQAIEFEWNYLSNRDVVMRCHWFYRCLHEFIQQNGPKILFKNRHHMDEIVLKTFFGAICI